MSVRVRIRRLSLDAVGTAGTGSAAQVAAALRHALGVRLARHAPSLAPEARRAAEAAVAARVEAGVAQARKGARS